MRMRGRLQASAVIFLTPPVKRCMKIVIVLWLKAVEKSEGTVMGFSYVYLRHITKDFTECQGGGGGGRGEGDDVIRKYRLLEAKMLKIYSQK